MAFTGSQYWAHQNQARFQTPTHNQLNPSVTSFHPNGQPNGTELQRYTAMPPPTPPCDRSAALPAELIQMRNYMLESHFAQTREAATAERKFRKHDDDLHSMQDAVGNDMRALQSEIAVLREQMQAQAKAQSHQGGMLIRYSRADQDITPPDEFMQNFSKQRIAEVYLEEADDYEKAARKLREQAKDICSEVVEALEGDETPTHRPARRRIKTEDEAEPPMLQIEAAAEPEKKFSTPEAIETMATYDEIPEKSLEAGTQLSTESVSKSSWIPLAIRQMPPAESTAISNTETFPFDLLKSELGGDEWSPGFYFVKKSSTVHRLPIRSYWIIESEFEPFLPGAPGLHGAKLTAFFNETCGDGDGQYPQEEDFDNVPVFICAPGVKEYRYFGHYRQTRYSDKLDMDHLLEDVPEKVRRYHAEQLADTGRPAWVREALKQHFWPRDEYLGPIPTDSALNTPKTEATQTDCSAVLEKRVLEALVEWANDLKEWDKEANLKVSLLTADSLMQAFAKADADEEPGLRLNLEYFQFLQYEQGFYDYLVKVKKDPKKYERPVTATKAAKSKTLPNVGGKMVNAIGGVIETLHPSSAENKIRLSDRNTIPTEESEQKWVDDKPESVQTAVKTATPANMGSKNHMHGIKPWEKKDKEEEKALVKTKVTDAEESLNGPSIANGSLEAAKVLQNEFKSGSGKEKGKGGGGGGGRKSGPPHLKK